MEAPSDGLTDLERMQVLETFLSLFIIIATIDSNIYLCKRRGRLQKCDKMARRGDYTQKIMTISMPYTYIISQLE